VCFIGRGNFRDDKDAYIFEYWKNAADPVPIPDSDDDCSTYDPGTLHVESLGDVGWTVIDGQDHTMGQFDTQVDADNAMIVLSKYNRTCHIWSDTLVGPIITYT
jgi:hypothetical protein